MLNRRSLIALPIALGVVTLATAAQAADKAPFTQAAFDAAKRQGRSVLVEVTAPWCPVCKAQAPILADLTRDPKFKNLAIFEVDFDSQKDALRALDVQKQSTLITFKSGREVGRSTGDTNRASIAALLEKTI